MRGLSPDEVQLMLEIDHDLDVALSGYQQSRQPGFRHPGAYVIHDLIVEYRDTDEGTEMWLHGRGESVGTYCVRSLDMAVTTRLNGREKQELALRPNFQARHLCRVLPGTEASLSGYMLDTLDDNEEETDERDRDSGDAGIAGVVDDGAARARQAVHARGDQVEAAGGQQDETGGDGHVLR